MNEAALQSAVLDLTRWLGLLAFHSGDSRRDSCAGFPDLLIAGQRGHIIRELKSEKGRIRPEQADWISRLELGGADVAVWRPADLHSGRVQRELTALTTSKGSKS